MRTASRTVLRLLAPLQLGWALSTVAEASDTVAAELTRCVAIAASNARLACYDKLAGHAADKVATPDHTTGKVQPATAPPITPITPKAPQPAEPAEPADATQRFGLSAAQLHAAPQGPQAIQAHIAQVNADQFRRNSVVLDNGQEWASTEGEMLLDSGEAVTIRRAALGSFMLTSAHSKHSYHVHRLR